MTEARIEALERRMASTEKRLHRYRVSLLAVVLVVAALGFMGATGDKNGNFDKVFAKTIFVKDSQGKTAVMLTSVLGDGIVGVYNSQKKPTVMLLSDDTGVGVVGVHNSQGKKAVWLSSNDRGGTVGVSNKTGEEIVQLNADDYGNGVVGAYNRKGMGRTLKPGP